MEMGVFVAGASAFFVFALVLIGGPAVLTDRIRHRREEVIRRQIALTDAIHGTLGAVASPVVRKPFVGSWQIRMAVPFANAEAVGRILALTHDVFSTFDGSKPSAFRVVLRGGADPVGEAPGFRGRRRAKQFAGRPAAA